MYRVICMTLCVYPVVKRRKSCSGCRSHNRLCCSTFTPCRARDAICKTLGVICLTRLESCIASRALYGVQGSWFFLCVFGWKTEKELQQVSLSSQTVLQQCCSSVAACAFFRKLVMQYTGLFSWYSELCVATLQENGERAATGVAHATDCVAASFAADGWRVAPIQGISLSLCLSLSHTHTHTHTHSWRVAPIQGISLSLCLSLAYTHTHTHTLTHKHKHTHTHGW